MDLWDSLVPDRLLAALCLGEEDLVFIVAGKYSLISNFMMKTDESIALWSFILLLVLSVLRLSHDQLNLSRSAPYMLLFGLVSALPLSSWRRRLCVKRGQVLLSTIIDLGLKFNGSFWELRSMIRLLLTCGLIAVVVNRDFTNLRRSGKLLKRKVVCFNLLLVVVSGLGLVVRGQHIGDALLSWLLVWLLRDHRFAVWLWENCGPRDTPIILIGW